MILILADRTNRRAYAMLTVSRLSSVVCDVNCIVAKRRVLEQKLLLTAYIGSHI